MSTMRSMNLSIAITLRDCPFRRRLRYVGHRTFDVFDTHHHARFAGDRGTIGEPSGAAAHRFAKEVRPTGGGVVVEVADFFGQRFDGREVTEGEVDPE
jgi:hypothetical protein